MLKKNESNETLQVHVLGTRSFLANLTPHFLSRQTTPLAMMEEFQYVWSAVYGLKFPTNHVSCLTTRETVGISHTEVIHFGLQTNNLRTACWKAWPLSYNQIRCWLAMCMSKWGQPFEAAYNQPSLSTSQITAQALIEAYYYHNANMLSRLKCGFAVDPNIH